MLRFQGLRIANVTKVFQVAVLLLATSLFVLHLGLVETPSFSRQILTGPSTSSPWDHVKRKYC